MANLHALTVQEATNLLKPRLLDVDCTTATSDHDENDVIFEWTEVTNFSRTNGEAVELTSASMLLPAAMGDQKATVQLVFSRGIGTTGTEPAQIGALDGAVDMTRAEAQAARICGSCVIGGVQDDLILSNVASNKQGGLRLIMAPASASTSIWVAGIARDEPAAAFTDTTINLYLGIYG